MADYRLDVSGAITDDEKRRGRRTTTRSFFPAANNALATGARATPYGGGSGNYGFGPNSGLVSPENNPAYQAAINPGRYTGSRATPGTSSGSAYTTIQLPALTPGEGPRSMVVPTGSAQRIAGKISGAYINPTGPLSPDQYASAKAKGYGAPAPSFNPETGTLASGGVEAPVESLTPQQRIQIPGSNPFLQQWGANFASQHPTLAALGTAAINTYQGLRGTVNTPAGNQYVNNLSTGQPMNNNLYAGSQPRRYFDPNYNYNF